jgi:hypothetical protein
MHDTVDFSQIHQEFFRVGFSSIIVTSMGSKMVLLEVTADSSLKDRISEDEDWLASMFYNIR